MRSTAIATPLSLWWLWHTFVATFAHTEPKQLLALNGEQTLLQQTASRLLAHVDAANLFTVTHEDHKFEVKGQLAEISARMLLLMYWLSLAHATPCLQLLGQSYQIYQKSQMRLLAYLHQTMRLITKPLFYRLGKRQKIAAQDDYLVLLGIKPHEPATGYGYIKPSQQYLNSGEYASASGRSICRKT